MQVTPTDQDLHVIARFGAVAIALICVQLDYFALALALPSMAAELDVSSTELQWSISGYMIAIGIAMVPGSRLADLIGRKRVLLLGLSIFGLASLWVGLSPTAESVIAARVLQGLGAGIYFPVAMSLVTNATNPVERPKILGMLTGIAGVGTALGPIIGGGLSDTIGWRWVFFVNVPVALIGVIWGHFQLDESKDPELSLLKVRNMDWIGVVLIAVGVTGVSLGIDDIATAGFWSPITIIPLILGIVALVVFVGWEHKSKWPLIPPKLWTNSKFSALVVAASIANAGLVVMIFVATLYLQEVQEFSGLVAGLMFIPAAIGLSIGGPLSGRMASRIPGQRVMTVAMLAGALTLVILALTSNTVIYLIVMGFASFFLGLGFQFGNIAVQSVVKESEAGTGAGVILTIMVTLGGLAVVAAAASINVVGDGFPTQAASTVTLLTWAGVVGVLGLIFGLSQWRKAELHAPPDPATEADTTAA